MKNLPWHSREYGVRNEDAEVNVPDAIEPIRGWRAWYAFGGRLHSMVYSDVEWAPNNNLSAVCKVFHSHPSVHRLPVEDCSCGFYASKSIEALRAWAFRAGHINELTSPEVVVGEVSLFGKVVVGEEGYRAERARPASLVRTPWNIKEISWVSSRYGLEIVRPEDVVVLEEARLLSLTKIEDIKRRLEAKDRRELRLWRLKQLQQDLMERWGDRWPF